MASIVDNLITVEVGSESFRFRIPSPRAMAKMGLRAHALRKEDAPGTVGSEYGLDMFTVDLYQGLALFETLLESADAQNNWPFSDDEKGQPVVDSDKFPADSTLTVVEVYRGFNEAMNTFLKKPVTDAKNG